MKHQIDDLFNSLLGDLRLHHLNEHVGPIYGVWPDFSIAYLNPGRFIFARDNDGEPNISSEWRLGRSIMDCIPDKLKELYEPRLKKCLVSDEAWDHDYECSSHDKYRKFHQIVYPLGKQKGLLIVNSQMLDRPHDSDQMPASLLESEFYKDDRGLVNQCAHCRRVRNFTQTERWDFVPNWVKQSPENTVKSLCAPCYEHYFMVISA